MAGAAAPIFILACPRSGTNMVRAALANDPRFRNYGEAFNPSAQTDTPKFGPFLVRWLADDAGRSPLVNETAHKVVADFLAFLGRQADAPRMLIDVKPDQLRTMDWPFRPLHRPPMLVEFIRDGGFPVVRLHRRDRLAQAVSMLVALRTNLWVVRESSEDEERLPESARTLRLDPAEVTNVLVDFDVADRSLDMWFENHGRLARLEYETAVEGGALAPTATAALERVLEIVLPERLPTRTRKITPRLQDVVENLDEIVEAVSRTRYRSVCDPYRR